MKSEVRRLAASLGFDAVGFAGSEGILSGRPLGRGFPEGLRYLENFEERLARFMSGFPEVRSLIVVGMNSYAPRRAAPEQDEPSGEIARFAWGEDYHKVIRNKLERLAAQIEELLPGTRSRVSVDTGPFLEKAAARQAGLGFIGKNTLLIHPVFGPWLLLGLLLTTAEFEPDPPLAGDCGPCGRCVTSCPTGALGGDYTLNAARCISYHTVESRTAVPPEIAERLGTRLFGCEACLVSCPRAENVPPHGHGEFSPERGPLERLALSRIDAIADESDYRRIFSGSALRRVGLDKLKGTARLVRTNLNRAKELKADHGRAEE